MLIDFCHPSAQSKIKTDKVSFDGYEVQNLISSDAEMKRKGFLSDHFIKPPVNITVQFPCNVSIYRIVIDPVIGQQKSCDLKIFTACEKMMDSWLYKTTNDPKVKTEGVLFSYAGNVTQVEPAVVCFINNQFKERNSWRIENIPDIKSYPRVTQLNSRKPGGLSNASHVTVCLNRSKGGRSVALKRLEIWGIPSAKVPVPIQNSLRNVFITATGPKETLQRGIPKEVVQPSELNSTTAINKEADKVLIDGVSVPDDFIDQITFEIMTVPVLLPCGKNIDQSTLERFVNTEASWGRPPSDPFTAVIFSQASGPVTNSSLKARIDQFVLKHSESLKVPQTLGRSDVNKTKKQLMVSSKLVSDQPVCESSCRYSVPELPECKTYSSSRKKCTLTDRSELQQRTRFCQDQSNFPKTSETSTDPDIYHPRSERKHVREKLPPLGSKRKSSVTEDALCIDLSNDTESDKIIPTKKQKLQTTDHNSELSQSLDNALLSALGNLPSYTKKASKPSSVDTSEKIALCSTCRSDLSNSDVIKYRTKCGHLICRSCIVQEAASFVCNVCFTKCQSSQAVRMF